MVSGSSNSAIMFELTCLVATATPFVQATFQLEGDGPRSMIVYDVIERLSTIRAKLLPGMTFVAVQTLAAKNTALVAKNGGTINRGSPTADAQVCV